MESKATILADKSENDQILRLSVSKVKTFTTCKAQYRFNYIEKLPQKDWEHLIFGKFVHEALELFHKDLIEGVKDAPNEIMSKCFKIACKNWEKSLSIEGKKEGFEILSQYLILLKNQEQDQTLPTFLAVEKKFYIDVDNSILINGFIDRVQLDPDGTLHVADYKTTKDKKYLKNDFFQLLTYAYVLCLEDPALKKVRGSYILLRHNFEMLTKDFERDEIMLIESKFLDYAQKIKSEKLFRPSTSGLCKMCSFLDHCEAGQESLGILKPKYGESSW